MAVSEYSHYFHQHYILNTIICLIYPIYKIIINKFQHDKPDESWVIQREYSVITAIGTMIILRFLKFFTNYKKFINEIFFYMKLGNTVCFTFGDYRLGCWYLFFCYSLWILFQVPRYTGPSNFTSISTEEMFKEKVFRNNNSKSEKNGDNYVFCLFYSNYSDNCLYTEDVFARLSIKYSSKNLIFIKVDIDIHQGICSEYKITANGPQSQLPVIILFKNGTLKHIYPGTDSKGKPLLSKQYRERELIKLFDLENITNA